MVLTTIYITRHAFRTNFSTNSSTGQVAGAVRTPTGIGSDVPLTAYGTVQAQELAQLADTLSPTVTRVYSSPFYRCLQTIIPLWSRLPGDVPLVCHRGLGEWYGKAPFEHDTAAHIDTLRGLFGLAGLAEAATSAAGAPDRKGETIAELHDRCARALDAVIAEFDASSVSREPEALVVCSHAAPIIAMGRALTGLMPDDPTTPDFDTFTCCVSRFERNQPQNAAESGQLDWRNGRGVGGGWVCRENAAVGHLKNGGERNWHFYGEESFVNFADSADGSGSAASNAAPKL